MQDSLTVYLIYFLLQNNNRGGYNVGDRTNKAANNPKDQYNMVQLLTTIIIYLSTNF